MSRLSSCAFNLQEPALAQSPALAVRVDSISVHSWYHGGGTVETALSAVHIPLLTAGVPSRPSPHIHSLTASTLPDTASVRGVTMPKISTENYKDGSSYKGEYNEEGFKREIWFF
jgi:hypothetical protein